MCEGNVEEVMHVKACGAALSMWPDNVMQASLSYGQEVTIKAGRKSKLVDERWKESTRA